MINDDVLRKWILRHETSEDFVSRINRFNRDLLRIKLGFKGMGNRHISLIENESIKRGYRILIDYYIDINGNNSARYLSVSPKLFQIVALTSAGDPYNLGILLGIGDGEDTHGDPNLELVIGKTYRLDSLPNYPVIIKVDSMGRYKNSDMRKRNV